MNRLISTKTPELFSKADAETVAHCNQIDDPDWSYQVVPTPRVGYFAVCVMDETGEPVGFL